MSSEQGDTQSGIISMITNPSSCTANWFIGLSMWGLFLAILNIFGYAHPNYHYSWGGLFTFEFTNVAYELKSDSAQIVTSDAIFIAISEKIFVIGELLSLTTVGFPPSKSSLIFISSGRLPNRSTL